MAIGVGSVGLDPRLAKKYKLIKKMSLFIGRFSLFTAVTKG